MGNEEKKVNAGTSHDQGESSLHGGPVPGRLKDSPIGRGNPDWGSSVAQGMMTEAEGIEGLQEPMRAYRRSVAVSQGSDTPCVFKKPKLIIGNNLLFRDATTADATFIVQLRTHEKKSAHISKTSRDVKAQEAWLGRYRSDQGQVYFVIFNNEGERVGTVRLYDIRGKSFCWGSWILKDGVPSSYAVESALLVYHFALSLGFEGAHFDVRKGNESVWRFHERFGARRTSETDEDYFYTISLDSIRSSLDKYRKYLPNGFSVG
jgi:RimJ/RimL family protein N-acetyltransferase